MYYDKENDISQSKLEETLRTEHRKSRYQK